MFRAALSASLIEARLELLQSAGKIGVWPKGRQLEPVLALLTNALEPVDTIFTGQSAIAPNLLRGATILEVLSKALGQGPLNLSSKPRKVVAGSGLVGRYLTHATGFAYGAKIEGDHGIAVAIFDAADVHSGDFHTALNQAAVWKVPLLFVAIASDSPDVGESISERCIAYGLPAHRVASPSLAALREWIVSARTAVQQGPVLLEFVAADPAPLWTAFRTLCAVQESDERAMQHEILVEIETALGTLASTVSQTGQTDHEALFQNVYFKAPNHLVEQAHVLNGSRLNRSKS